LRRLIIISSVPPVVIQGARRIELGWREDWELCDGAGMEDLFASQKENEC
jgi:hypothetical protein